jgi:hypothetical protein
VLGRSGPKLVDLLDQAQWHIPCPLLISLKTSRVSKCFNVQVSAVSGITTLDSRIEEAMNCGNCNSIINYNYVTDCPQCGCAVEKGDLLKLDLSTGSGKTKSLWRYVVNLIYVLVTSGVSMISGAVVIYYSAAVIYSALSSPETYPGEHCSRGMAVGMLSVLTGGFLGTVAGTAFGLKHPLVKPNDQA